MSSQYFIFSVTTPNINSLLAIPFKKEPVDSSKEFKTEWSAKKEYVRRVTGHGGSYQANKERRRSESFPWHNLGRTFDFLLRLSSIFSKASLVLYYWNINAIGSSVTGSSTESSSMMSSNPSCIAANTDKVTEEHFLSQMDDLENKLKDANSRIAELSSEVYDLKIDGKHKNDRIKSLLKANLTLRRQIPGKHQVSRVWVDLFCLILILKI